MEGSAGRGEVALGLVFSLRDCRPEEIPSAEALGRRSRGGGAEGDRDGPSKEGTGGGCCFDGGGTVNNASEQANR